VAGGLADHGFGLGTNRIGLAAVSFVDCYNRGLGDDYALPPHMNKGIGCAQVYTEIATEKAEQSVQGAYHENGAPPDRLAAGRP
jgi:hypothetical protein